MITRRTGFGHPGKGCKLYGAKTGAIADKQTSLKDFPELRTANFFSISGTPVLDAIDKFDNQYNNYTKLQANYAILAGDHISECSDAYGTFSSAIIKNPEKRDKHVRPVNQPYHELYNGHGSRLKYEASIILFSLILFFM